MKQTKKISFGKRSGLTVYPVSIGAMRLCQQEMEESTALIRKAIDTGMVYIDTSRGYEDSERRLAKALKNGYRQKVILSSKWAPWIKKIEDDDDTSAECTYKRIRESLERLETDYLDFYQIWNIHTPEQFKLATQKGGMVDGIKQAMTEGIVKHTGFTTHDKPENVMRYIDEAGWAEAILFSYNMFNPAYKECIAKAHSTGIATIVMNPLAGGMFAEGSAVIKQAVMDAVGCEDPVQAALRYLAGDKNVDTIICGIIKPSDIDSTLANYELAPFTTQERTALEKTMAAITKESQGLCTSCKYCLPCKAKIDIPAMMNIAYHHRFLQVPEIAAGIYKWLAGEDNPDRSAKPHECLQCGQCEQKCTQRLKIIKEMGYLAENFE